MKIVCINVLISILFLKQILNVLSHSIVELTLGELYDNTQLSKSLSFYKILDLPNKDIKIFLRTMFFNIVLFSVKFIIK